MPGLKPTIKALFKQLKVRIDNPDGDTLLLRNVPVDARSFSKASTNVLVKRPRAGLPFLVCVDEDLEYVGSDSELARTFAAASRREGWRVVSAGSGVYPKAEDAVRHALAMLGIPGAPAPVEPAKGVAREGLLERFAADLTAQVREGSAPRTVARGELAEQAAASLLAWQRRLPIIVGAPGLGKTNLLYKVAGHLAEVRPQWDVLAVDLGCLLTGVLFEGEREKLLSAVLDEAAAHGKVALMLERLEVAAMTVPLAPWLLAAALDRGAQLAATCLPLFAEKLSAGPLARRIDVIDVTELARQDTAAVLGHLRGTLADHHRVAIDSQVVDAAMERSLTLGGSLPDKAIALLDAAAARAALLRQPAVTLCDVYLAASRMKE